MIPFFLLKLWKGRDYSVFNPVDNREYTVNYAGFRILEKCDGTHTPEEIVGVIVRDFGKTENEAIGYVSQFLDSMTRHGMIAWRKETVNNVPDWGPPTTVFWDITRRCNLLCSHCYNIEKQPRGDELSTEIVKRIVEELSAYGVSNIVFSGGEPFLRKDFLAIIQHVSAYAFQDVSIATNGVLVDGKGAKKLRKAGVNVQISIDGDTAVLHDEIRGVSGAFDGAIRGIHLLQTVGVPVSVCTVVTKKNVNRIDRIIALMHDLHIDNYRVQGVMSIGRGKTNKADLRLTPARMKRLVMQLETRAIPVSSYNFTLTDPPGGPVNFKGTGACAVATSSCSITTEGTVVPCTYFWGIKGDNVRDHTFGWIWENSPVLQYFRSIRLDEVKGLCGDCRWLAHCHGGCKAENYVTGDIFSSNISCWVADANRRSASKKKTLMKG